MDRRPFEPLLLIVFFLDTSLGVESLYHMLILLNFSRSAFAILLYHMNHVEIELA